jgi:hypothetical protein
MPFSVLHQRRINTDTEKLHSLALACIRRHWAAIADNMIWCSGHGALQSTGPGASRQMR